MTEHPAWHSVAGELRRAFVKGERLTFVSESVRCSQAASGHLDVDVFDLAGIDEPFIKVGEETGIVHRVRNPNLWDAIATAIIRQVVRASQARLMYQRLCRSNGASVSDSEGYQYWLLPSPARLLEMQDDDFARLGMTLKRKGLRSAALAYLECGHKWGQLSPTQLVDELISVSHIGPWTARAAVADFSNDWALYPFSDLAVRTWARRAMPTVGWASDEAGFASQWRELAGDRIGDVTLMTLAWGDRYVRARTGGDDRGSRLFATC